MNAESILFKLISEFEEKASEITKKANWAIGKERELLDSQANAYQNCADRIKARLETLT